MSRTLSQATLLLLSWHPLESWLSSWQVMRSTWPWHSWWFATCECRVDGSDNAAVGERELSGLCLPAVIEGASLLFSKCNRVWCGPWHHRHLCCYWHYCLKYPNFRPQMQLWLLFTDAMCWSCDNDLNFLDIYIRGACLHHAQCRN